MISSFYNEIFITVRDRIISKKESLDKLLSLNSSISFEGWLKVEAICALSNVIEKVNNRGIDLELKNDCHGIELKASTDNLNKNYFTNSRNEYYTCPVLFIAKIGRKGLEKIAADNSFRIIGQSMINEKLMIGFVIHTSNSELENENY